MDEAQFNPQWVFRAFSLKAHVWCDESEPVNNAEWSWVWCRLTVVSTSLSRVGKFCRGSIFNPTSFPIYRQSGYESCLNSRGKWRVCVFVPLRLWTHQTLILCVLPLQSLSSSSSSSSLYVCKLICKRVPAYGRMCCSTWNHFNSHGCVSLSFLLKALWNVIF